MTTVDEARAALPSAVCDLTGARHHDLVERRSIDALIAAIRAECETLDVERQLHEDCVAVVGHSLGCPYDTPVSQEPSDD